ncbi:PREDICTED: proline-rich protein HaeIII subfamily 1-like [Capra hircus]|uniref:proline-rich protein HaeIII subfamily 1-like n=1 Tax=Capra hircus TaxID=9925 RepID=UPI0008472E56|nr:PREDICTED: proline-rich protein HaeIII subfamily 1-like [Capra hircus]
MRLGPEQGSAEPGDGLEPQGESGAQSPSRGRGAEGRRPGQGRPTPRGPGRRPQGPPGLRGPTGAGVPSRPGPEGSPGLCRSPFSGARRSSRGRRTRPGHGAEIPPPPLLDTPSLEVTLPSHPRTPHFRFRRGQRPRHSPAASPASPPPPPPPGSAVRPLRGSARPPHARRPPRDARARPATLRLPAGARPLPSGPGRPPSLRSHWLLAPGARVAACALTPATAATSRPDWLREQSAAPRENTRERACAGPSGSAGDRPWRTQKASEAKYSYMRLLKVLKNKPLPSRSRHPPPTHNCGTSQTGF